MASFRQRAIDLAATHRPERFYEDKRPISAYFGEDVFDLDKMGQYLSTAAYASVKEAVKNGKPIDRKVAGEIAEAMKNWAISKGATHFTHLFQPLTGNTAEKHDAFLGFKDGKPVESFSGDALVQQEPDASSFPSGGLRNTFEARGYTAWDPTSPVFILDGTLCIPSVFVSYNGDALDMKVPNLRSLDALDKAATKVAQLFDPNVKSVHENIGLEQEYFLVDESLYNARPDLKLCDRTVIGHTSAKDQQLSDHYFGSIPSRAEAFMKDFETVAYKLGIRLITRHNEVAPNQFECAPVYTEATRAIDNNMTLMIIMQKVAGKHHLRVLFSEKPFDGVNGSGKHCNWSLETDTGVNLLKPSADPEKNLQFLAFYSAVAKGVNDHNFLIMTSVCDLSNSYRLGGNEAPVPIMSIYSGATLSKLFKDIVETSSNHVISKKGGVMKIAEALPEIELDNTDRNRTSPFAFTGNRFEFRALGSSANGASATYVINASVAESLQEFSAEVEKLQAEGKSKNDAIIETIRDFLIKASPVMFDGNGYSKEWIEEAKKRGLKGVTNVPEAYKTYLSKDTEDLFGKLGILSKREIEARYEVLNETYVKKLQIEARVLGDICLNHVIPAAVSYQNILLKSVEGMKEIFGKDYETMCKSSIGTLKKISGFINSLSVDVEELVERRKKANAVTDIAEKAKLYSTGVKEMMDKVRYSADHLEMIVDDELWPLPKYREMLFF
jgi:glutamine synthetase